MKYFQNIHELFMTNCFNITILFEIILKLFSNDLQNN